MYGYQRDAYLESLATRVTGLGEAGGRTYVLLEDTVFYPEGGGQPADHGMLGPARVTAVEHGPDGIRHFVDECRQLAEGHELTARIDWARRFDHMQQHTAQHLLTALAQDRYGWPTTAFHLGDTASDIELDVPQLGEEELQRLEDAAAAEIRAARPVRPREVTADEIPQLPVRTRGLPDPPPPRIRLVEIEGIDLNTCGGTHLGSTAEIEAIKLIGTEPMRGGTRVFFVAGRRLARRLAAHESRNAALRDLLGAADADLPEVVAGKLEQLKDALRASRRLGEALAASTAEALAARAPADGDTAVQVVRLPIDDPKLVQAAARRFSAEASAGVALVLGGDGPAGPFALGAARDAGHDLAALGGAVAAALEGRGGGKDVYQGKGARIDLDQRALEALRDALAGS